MEINVLFIIFNKSDETKRVFNAIRSQKPARLFIAADGPRPGTEGEAERCQLIRNWVLEHVDWSCELKTLFRDENRGCGRGPSEAISWFFEHVDEGIILEDDCLPNPTFFQFCADLLGTHRDNRQVSMISGNNFQLVQPMPIEADYYFSVFPSSNGWATWKRSWEGFDYTLSNWPRIDKKQLSTYLFAEKPYARWWLNQFDWLYRNKPDDMWDFQFHYLCMTRGQLAVIPKANLVSNIGYGPYATHSQNPDSYFANVPTHELAIPFTHPERIERHYEADLFIQRMLFGQAHVDSQFKKFKRVVKKVIRYNPM
ncbi:nucleotide-diphospho-sugar transferase [Spirosoma fluminis]